MSKLFTTTKNVQHRMDHKSLTLFGLSRQHGEISGLLRYFVSVALSVEKKEECGCWLSGCPCAVPGTEQIQYDEAYPRRGFLLYVVLYFRLDYAFCLISLMKSEGKIGENK